MPHLLTVTMNPSIDIHTTVERVIRSRKLRCGPERRDPGAGVNVARVAPPLGWCLSRSTLPSPPCAPRPITASIS